MMVGRLFFSILFILAAPASGDFPPGGVRLGIDRLIESGFEPLKGRRVGLIVNHTARSRDNLSTIDLLHETRVCELVALFAPEHGIRGDVDTEIDSSRDEATGLMIHSLYGKTRKPTPDMLKGIDTLVFDIQDIGTRFYTYIGAMALAMQAAREANIRFVVLDRPNPIGGRVIGGAIPPPEQCGGITSIHPIPTRHGMTIGELAQLLNAEMAIGCDLTVIPMQGWRRGMFFDSTGLFWRPTSPNMKTLLGALCYPGLGVLEGTTLSCARGTDRPFETYGAPWLNAAAIAGELNQKNIPGARFVSQPFTPTAPGHPFEGQPCEGVFVVVFDRERFDPFLAGLHFIQIAQRLHPADFTQRSSFPTLIGDPDVWRQLTVEGVAPETLLADWEKRLATFRTLRAAHLIPEYGD